LDVDLGFNFGFDLGFWRVMSENNLDENNGGPATPAVRKILITALVAGTVGFLAIYVGFMPKDNGQQPKAVKALKKLECPRPAKPGKAALNRFNCGDMISFVVSKTPTPMKNVSFQNNSGETVSLEDWRGKYVLLNIWATWCVPCRREMPELEQLSGPLAAAGIDLVGISIDTDTVARVVPFLRQVGTTYPVHVSNDERIPGLFDGGAIVVPLSILLDDTGRVLRVIGGWSVETAEQFHALTER
jgi:thiol-disulfide isomerase/thioredoxin